LPRELKLLQIVLAGNGFGGALGSRKRGQEHRRQYPDGRDDDEQFDQGEAAPISCTVRLVAARVFRWPGSEFRVPTLGRPLRVEKSTEEDSENQSGEFSKPFTLALPD
jgi:hypothetical protein